MSSIKISKPLFDLPINYETTHYSVRRLVREEYVRLQDGKCWYCEKPLTGKPSKKVRKSNIRKELFPPNFFDWPCHLHHNHDTGMTIGAVHARCNAHLWQYHGE